MAQHRSVPPRLSLPPAHPFNRQLSNSARYYPVFTPTSRSAFSPVPTPTPSKYPRAPEGPIWLFTLLQLLPAYALYKWLSPTQAQLPLMLFSFFALLGSALFLNVMYHSWKGRAILPSQWGLIVGSGGILGLSCFLRFEAWRWCGPLESIFADFAGALVAKVFLDPINKSSRAGRKIGGVTCLLVGVFLLSQGWSRASCFPLAVNFGFRTRMKERVESKDCVKMWVILAPLLGGFLSAFQRLFGASAHLKNIGKKRVQVISYAVGATILFPFAMLELVMVGGQDAWQLNGSLWPMLLTVAFGQVVGFFGDFYSEEKLLRPVQSLKSFQIVACCACGLELLYGLDISLAGFLFCTLVLGLGVQKLAFLPGQLSWEALGDTDNDSLIYASWIKRPLVHVMSDKKSRKIAIFLLINTGFMVIEFFYGFLSNSLGLISDACHMLFDCAALAIGLYASYISRLPANSRFNYGYGRFEVVSGYANAVLLVLIASLIVLESIERILEPPEISTESLLLVSVGGLLVNVVGLIFFHEEHHHAHGGGGGSCSGSHSNVKLHDSQSSYDTLKGDNMVTLHNMPSLKSEMNTNNSQNAGSSLKTNHNASYDHQHSLAHKQTALWVPDDNAEEGQHRHHESNDCHRPGSAASFSSQDVHGQQQWLHFHGQDDPSHHNVDGYLNNGQNHKQCNLHSDENQEHHNHECHKHNHNDEHDCKDHNHHDKYDYKDHKHGHDHTFQSQDHQDHQHDGHECQNHKHVNGHECQDHDHHYNDVSSGHGHHDHRLGHCDEHGSDSRMHVITHGHDHHCHHDHEHDHSHSSKHNHHHHHHMDHNMYGIFLHVLADTLGSVGVVISTILIKYKGWLITDPACSIFLSALIIASVIPLLRNSAEIVLQRVPRYNESTVRSALKSVSSLPNVKSIQQVHTWSYTNTNTVGSLHLQISAGSDKTKIRERVTQLLHNAGIADLTLQIEEM